MQYIFHITMINYSEDVAPEGITIYGDFDTPEEADKFADMLLKVPGFDNILVRPIRHKELASS